MSQRKHPAISVHPTWQGQLEVNWETEYNNEFQCPHCFDEDLLFYYRKSKSFRLEIRCRSCQKSTQLTCSIPGAGKRHLPISTHETLKGKLQVNWHLEYNHEFSCPHCHHEHLIFHYYQGTKTNLALDCTWCRKTIYLTCQIPGTGKIYFPISTHETLKGKLQVNWHLEYNNEFSCPHCNHENLRYYFRKDKVCHLVMDCNSCGKNTYLTCLIPGTGIKHWPISTHQTLKDKLQVNWYLEYNHEFECPYCQKRELSYCSDKTKGVGLTLECRSCLKKTALTCKVPAYIYNYRPSLECPNPLCTQLGHEQQKGWIYKEGDKTDNCKCYFCGINFKPTSNHLASWVGSQVKPKIFPFNFEDNSWDIRNFGYQHHSIKKIHFSNLQPPWYLLIVKKYIYYLLKSQTVCLSSIPRKLTPLRELGQLIQGYQIQTIEELSREIILNFLDNCQDLQAITFHHKISFLKNFLEWLGLDDTSLIRGRDYPKLRRNPSEWLDHLTRQGIQDNLAKIPAPIARYYLIQEYTAARVGDACQMTFDCLVEENGQWYIKFFQHKTQRWHQLPADRQIRRVIEEQQQWIRETLGSDYSYLFCHFRSFTKKSYPYFSSIKPLPQPPKVRTSSNPMVRIIRMLIENENILDANGQKPHFTGKITRPSRLQEVRIKHGIEAAQLYADHQQSSTTFQHYTPPTREEVAKVDLPFQELLMNPENKFIPWQSLPESLLKNPKAHELDLEISPRLVVYGHCTLDPKTPCIYSLYPKCYGCNSFRPSTGKLPFYERQYAGEQQRMQEAASSGAELAYEEAKSTLEAMAQWLPDLRKVAHGKET